MNAGPRGPVGGIFTLCRWRGAEFDGPSIFFLRAVSKRRGTQRPGSKSPNQKEPKRCIPSHSPRSTVAATAGRYASGWEVRVISEDGELFRSFTLDPSRDDQAHSQDERRRWNDVLTHL